MENVYLALIVAIPALLSPLLLAWLTNWNARKDRKQDWQRQDEVASRAAEASRKLLASQEAARAALDINTRSADLSRREIYSQLTALHTLGNSHTTALIRAELDSTRRELAALREIMAIKIGAGHKPSVEALAVIETAERRIAELETLMAERKLTDELAMAQIEEGQTAGKMADAATVAAKPAAEEAARRVVPPVVTEVVPPVVKTAVKEALAEHDKKIK